MKKLVLLVAVLTMVVFVSGVMAQQNPAPAPTPAPAPAPAEKAKPAKMARFSGTVQKVDEAAKIVTIKGKKEEKTFTISDMTKVTKGGKKMALADLKEGTNVFVQYKSEEGKDVASAIRVSAPKTVKKPAKPMEKPAEAAPKGS